MGRDRDIATLRSVVSPAVASNLLADTDATSENLEGTQFDDVVGTVRLLTALAPTVVFEQLELYESRKMRRVFIEALSAVGPKLLPLVRQKLHATSWFVVRNALMILPRVGGTPAGLATVANHANEKVRLEVLRALRLMPLDTRSMDYIAAYLTDRQHEIRQHSVVLLRGELLSVDAINRLGECYAPGVLLADAPLTLREFMTNEPLPLASIFREIFLFLTTRTDAVLFGAHAVNAYCEPERMTQDVDVLSTDAPALAEDLRGHLAATFHVAARVREAVPGIGFRVYQVRKPKNRHLVDVRQVAMLPAHRVIDGVRVVEPAELVAMKACAMAQRQRRPKGSTDFTDLQRLLLAFPDLKTSEGPVAERLRALGAPDAAFATWRDVVRQPIEPDEDEGDEERE